MPARLDDARKLDLPDPTEKTVGALCHDSGLDPEIFFSDREGDIAFAKATCRDCPVIDACRDYAFTVRPEFGVWGGLHASEIRKLVRRGQNQARRMRKAA